MKELNWRETWDNFDALLILRQWERLVNLKTMFYNVERDFDQEVRYIASFMGKFLEGDLQVKEKIGQYVALKGLRPEMQSAVVMWWRISSKYSQKLSIPKFRPQRLKRKGFLI